MTHILETTIDPQLHFCNHEDESTNARVKERILHILGYIPLWLYNPMHSNKDIAESLNSTVSIPQLHVCVVLEIHIKNPKGCFAFRVFVD